MTERFCEVCWEITESKDAKEIDDAIIYCSKCGNKVPWKPNTDKVKKCMDCHKSIPYKFIAMHSSITMDDGSTPDIYCVCKRCFDERRNQQ